MKPAIAVLLLASLYACGDDPASVATPNHVSLTVAPSSQGCGQGFWKQSQHFSSWPAAYSPVMPFATVFNGAFADMTLLEVLEEGGGGIKTLGRQAVAAVLNAGTNSVAYGMTPAQVIAAFSAAHATGKFESLARELEARNNRDCPVTPAALPGLATPNLVFTGSEEYLNHAGDSYTRYRLTVVNWLAFPDSLFAPAPNLPPCGLNTAASRTWVQIYDSSGNYLYGFCGAGAGADILQLLWFGLPTGTTPPVGVYIWIWDRLTGQTATSNIVAIP